MSRFCAVCNEIIEEKDLAWARWSDSKLRVSSFTRYEHLTCMSKMSKKTCTTLVLRALLDFRQKVYQYWRDQLDC